MLISVPAERKLNLRMTFTLSISINKIWTIRSIGLFADPTMDQNKVMQGQKHYLTWIGLMFDNFISIRRFITSHILGTIPIHSNIRESSSIHSQCNLYLSCERWWWSHSSDTQHKDICIRCCNITKLYRSAPSNWHIGYL